MTLLDRYRTQAVDLSTACVHPEYPEIMAGLAKEWTVRDRKLQSSGVPTAGLGFTGPALPNTEPIVPPATVAPAATTETNLYTPANSTNATFGLIPIGVLRAPQSWRIFAGGTIQTSTSGLSCAFTSRVGTSATPSTNATLGATGNIPLPSTLTTLWWYEGHITVRSPGSTGTAIGIANVNVGNAAIGSITGQTTALSGSATAVTVDTTIQQGYVISVTVPTITVTIQLLHFTLIAWD